MGASKSGRPATGRVSDWLLKNLRGSKQRGLNGKDFLLGAVVGVVIGFYTTWFMLYNGAKVVFQKQAVEKKHAEYNSSTGAWQWRSSCGAE